jgi:restriction endonuclease
MKATFEGSKYTSSTLHIYIYQSNMSQKMQKRNKTLKLIITVHAKSQTFTLLYIYNNVCLSVCVREKEYV